MQVTSNYLQMKTVDIKSKNSEMNITRHENPKLLQLSKTYQTNAQLLQDSWTASANRTGYPDNGFSYTAYASSAELTASVVSWTASALKTCTSSNTMQANEKTTDAFKFK